jgi:NAD-dependent SIR2 family protein deacetylase
MALYATGTFSEAICDRCGQRYKYLDLKKEWTGFKVCPECYEPKAPQLYPLPSISEPQALYEPRPDIAAVMAVVVGQTVFPQPENISTQGITSVGVVTVTTT